MVALAAALAGCDSVEGAVKKDGPAARAVVEKATEVAKDLGARPLGRPDQSLQLGGHRAASSLEGRRLVVQVEPRSAPPQGGRPLSTWDPLSADERAEADALIDELTTLLESAGLADRVALLANEQAPLAAFDAPEAITSRRASFERLGALHQRGPRIVLYLVEG